MLHPGVTQEWVDESELPRERTKNRRWQKPYDVLAEATREEVVVRRSQIVSTSESHGGDLIIQRYDQSSWRVGLLQCSHSLKGVRQVREQGQRRDFRGVIDPLLSWRESISHKRGRGGRECKGKLQVLRQGRRAEANELHKTNVDGLLIKIVESEGLRVDTGVLDQGTK
ncbi:hypothetical protein GW17_00061863 [Ensete ventricosum]|nr:hypothetical protein GW17_00061863 [Ensete ventricosum]